MEEMLSKNPDIKIYRLSGISVCLLVASFIIPRFVSNPEGGFASGASAILALMVLIGATLLFSLYLLSVTIQSYSDLSTNARVAGIGPSIILAVTLLGLFGFLGY